MTRYIGFDAISVDYAAFRPDRNPYAPDAPTSPPVAFEANGKLIGDGVDLPLAFNGWHPAVTPAARQALEAALLEVTYQMIAAELQLSPGDGLKLDVGKIRIAAEDETPDWVLGG